MRYLHIFKRSLLVFPVAIVVLFGLCSVALMSWVAPEVDVIAILMEVARVVLPSAMLVLLAGLLAIWLFRDMQLGTCDSWWHLWDMPGWLHYMFVAAQAGFLGSLASIILVVAPVGFAHRTMPNADGNVVLLVHICFAVAHFLCVYWPFMKPEARAKIPVMRWIYGDAAI